MNQQLLVQHFFVVVEELLVGAWDQTLGVVSSGDMNLVIWNKTKELLIYLLKGWRYKMFSHHFYAIYIGYLLGYVLTLRFVNEYS